MCEQSAKAVNSQHEQNCTWGMSLTWGAKAPYLVLRGKKRASVVVSAMRREDHPLLTAVSGWLSVRIREWDLWGGRDGIRSPGVNITSTQNILKITTTIKKQHIYLYIDWDVILNTSTISLKNETKWKGNVEMRKPNEVGIMGYHLLDDDVWVSKKSESRTLFCSNFGRDVTM